MSRILIVDDDPQGLYMLESLLKGHGHQVVAAVNGADALTRARQDPPDAIVSDFFMPTMDGFALCRECKRDGRLKDVPFIAYTATYTDAKDEELALALGAARFLIKPIEPEVLLREIERVLADSQAGRLASPPGRANEEQYLREYNEALIRKLEKKVAQFQEANLALKQSLAERTRSQETLREAQDLLDEVGRIARVGGWKMDLITRSATWTQGTYDIVELAANEAPPGPDDHADYYLPEYRPMVAEAIRALVENGKPLDFEAELRAAKGNVKWCRVMGRAVRKGGKAVELRGIIQDITEQRKLLEQLLQSQKMEAIGLLAGGIAHDFRNQLTVVMGYGEMLMQRGMVKEEAVDYVRQIVRAGDRSADLCGQLLAFSRQQKLRPTVANLDNVIAGLSKSLSRMVGEDVRLSVVPCGDLGNVKTDIGQFQQAIMNMVVNARDAMPTGGQLTIETSNVDVDESMAKQHADIPPGAYVMTAVSDTGVGMDKATLKRIFEPFFTTKPAGHGTGLGLSMVYGFVRQSEGHISVYSECGLGTTFRIYLPRVLEELTANVEAAQEAAALPTGTGTLLVVEDEEAIRKFVAHALREFGYTVLEASCAKDALPLGEHYDGKIDLLITDVVMPGMSGPEVASKVLAARPGLPVLYLSGYTGKALANRGVLPSDVNLLIKPFSPHMLVEAVQRLLEEKP